MAQGPLASPRFQHERLQHAASDERYPIKKGTPRGYPVAAIQYTLHQLGFALPKSIHNGVPDGKFGDETHGAVVQLQSRKGLGKQDGKAGPKTLSYLDAELQSRPDKGGPIPGWTLGGASPAPPGPSPSTAVPPGYETLPPTLLATLRASYDGKTSANQNLADAMGFPPGAHTPSSKSFKEVLDTLKAQKRLDVIEAVHKRCPPSLWGKIHAIRWVWHYAQGNNVSQGFAWTSKDADGAIGFLRGSPIFCEDIFPMNADHQRDLNGRWCLRRTFREIVVGGGEGLHVCVVVPSYRAQDPWGGEHDIHIDRKQIICKKYRAMPGVTMQAPDGSCFYVDLVEHAKDAIPYYLKKFGIDAKLEGIIGGLASLAQTAGGLQVVTPAQAAGLFTKALPLMPQAVAAQAGQWLIQVLKNIAARPS